MTDMGDMESIELHTLGPIGKFFIEVHDGDDTFYAGQMVAGNLEINVQQELAACGKYSATYFI